MKINGKEYDFDKMFEKVYCTEEDIEYRQDLASKKIKISLLNRLEVESKIYIGKKFWKKVTNKVKLYYKRNHRFSKKIAVNCINEVIKEMVKRNNKTLEIE